MGTITAPANTTTKPKTHFKTKADWADARAAELRAQVQKLRYETSNGSTSKARQKFECIANLNREAMRYENMARHYRGKGI